MAGTDRAARLRRLKYGSLATGLSIALIAVIIILNVVCTTLTTRFSLKLDITGNDLYKLDNQTRQIIDKVDKDVTFSVVSSEESFATQFSEILRRITNASDHFTLTFVDPDKNPTFATSFGSQYNISSGSLVMQCGGKIRVVSQKEMYESDQQSGAVTYLLEERVAAALLSFTQDVDQKIYFVIGHGESSDQTLRNLFANNGFVVEDLRLYKDMSFDEKATMMVINAPVKDYSTAEISAMEKFLSNAYDYGRHLCVFTDATSTELPNLDSMLYAHGLVFERNMVLEADETRIVNLPSTFQPLFSSDDELKKLRTPATPMLVAAARSVTARFTTNGNITVTTVLTTGDDAYAKSTAGSMITTSEKESGDAKGPFNVAALSRTLKVYNNQDVSSCIFACGSTQMMTSDYMAYSGNGDFMMDLYAFMTGQDNDTVLDAVKYSSSQLMTLTDAQKRAAEITSLAVLPGLALLIGVVVIIRRRRL